MKQMQSIVWSDRLETGIPQIDDGHKNLVEALNELFAACFVGQGKATLSRLLDHFAGHIEQHFAEEELHLAQSGYEQLTTHIKEHENFLDKIATIRQNAEVEDLSHETLDFLYDWIVTHLDIEGQDMRSLHS